MAPRERSEEVHLWYTAVYEAVQEIPHGKVTSYGHIARLLGKREHTAYPPHDDTWLTCYNHLAAERPRYYMMRSHRGLANL
jgi:hypothetical protein